MLKDSFEPASPPRTPHGASCLAPLRLRPCEDSRPEGAADPQPGTPTAAVIRGPPVCPGAPKGPPMLSLPLPIHHKT